MLRPCEKVTFALVDFLDKARRPREYVVSVAVESYAHCFKFVLLCFVTGKSVFYLLL